MLLSAVSVLVVAQSSSEIPEGLMNNPVHSLLLDPLYVSSHREEFLCMEQKFNSQMGHRPTPSVFAGNAT